MINRPRPAAKKQYQPFATGKKVYSNGTNAPTRGTVNPAGYIKRELTNGPRRSGIAKAAINRVEGGRGFGGIIRGKGPTGMRPPVSKRPYVKVNPGTGPQNGGRPASGGSNVQGWLDPNQGPQGGQANVQGWLDPIQEAAANRAKPMNVTPNGQLDLPYDDSFAWELLGAKQNMNQSLLDLQMQQQQQSLNYGQQKREAEYGFEDLSRRTLNADAARGMAFSSGYGNNVARNATKYNNYMSDLDANNNLFNQGIDVNRMQIGNSMNEMLRMAALQRAQGLEGQAGDLGFGEGQADNTIPNPFAPAAPVGKPKAPSKPKPKPKPSSPKRNNPPKSAGARAERGKGKPQPKPAPKKKR